MLEKIGKGLLAGLGAVVLTKDKVEEVVRKMAEEVKLSNEDARRLTDELVETGEHQWEEMDKAVTESLRRGLDKMDVGSRKEVEQLKARVDNLEKRLARLEQAGPGVTQPGAMVITTGVKPLLFGFPALGIIGYLISALLGLGWSSISSARAATGCGIKCRVFFYLTFTFLCLN